MLCAKFSPKIVSRWIGVPASRWGNRLSPGRAAGALIPVAARIVGMMSMLLITSLRSAGPILPGQENMMGVRTPASYGEAFERVK